MGKIVFLVSFLLKTSGMRPTREENCSGGTVVYTPSALSHPLGPEIPILSWPCGQLSTGNNDPQTCFEFGQCARSRYSSMSSILIFAFSLGSLEVVAVYRRFDYHIAEMRYDTKTARDLGSDKST